MRIRCVSLLIVLVLLPAGCGSGSLSPHNYRVPSGDRHVIDDTYDRMLTALEHSRANDPAETLNGATAGQRMLYVMFFVDDEIGNGGLYQVYWNLRGGFIEEAVRDANLIGAHHWANLVHQAGHALFPSGLPNDVKAQRKLIGCPSYCDKGTLDHLTRQWRDGELRPPLLLYVHAHPADFYTTAS
jgi:hypothetical protein